MNLTLAQLMALGLAVAAPARDVPPDFKDRFHVPVGCVVSTEVYIQKLAETRPDMKARHLKMTRRGEDHTMALVTNRAGQQFARDEYVGVLDLQTNESQQLPDAHLAKKALAAHDDAARRNPYQAVTRAETTRQMRDAAEKVQTMLPEARVWKTSEGAFVVWDASPSEKFVYVADRGTMCIEPRKSIPEQQLATALSRNLQLGALQQQQQTTPARQTAALTR